VQPDRLARTLGDLSGEGATQWSCARLCEATRDIVGVSGAGIMLMSGDVQQGSLCTTNDVSNLIEELQYTLGEGPCVDAYQHNRVVVEPDLAQPRMPRWLAFASQALAAGVRAVYAFPLQLGTVRLGALDLYRDQPGSLSDDQHADAMAMAEVIATWVLHVQAQAPAGSIAKELERDADFHFVVHNAAGMVSVQLGVSITEALIRLRAYAFSHDRSLRDVAEDLVTRKVRF
jgi:GAF domain-containing protein